MTTRTRNEWRYSRKRLAAIDERLAEIEAESSALDIGREAPRFANAADRDRWDELDREWKRLYNERERCVMAVWRRRNRRRYGSDLHRGASA